MQYLQPCWNVSTKPKFLIQNCESFLGIKLPRIKTSFVIGSSWRVELGFYNTAGYFPLKVWKKIWNCKIRKKVTSFECFVWTRTRQFGEPTREFLDEPSNVFRSQSEQLCKFVTIPKKYNFSSKFASGRVKCSSESPDFLFAECPN